jgi:AraC-like DNA-binding protein
VVEGAVPLQAIGIGDAAAGRTLALDLAWNDWIEDHPRLPELLKDLENLAQLIGKENERGAALVDPDSLGWDGLLEWEARAYRAWSWRSGRDFGRPAKWATVQLVGSPPWLDRLVSRWGVGTLLAVSLAALVMAALLVDLELRRRYHRRVRQLLGRIAALERPAPAPEPDPAPPAPAQDRPGLLDRLEGLPVDEAAADTVTRMLAQVRENLAQPLPVSELAAAIGVSTRTLQRACQDELGASPRDVILAVKMRRAHELLASGRWRVGEVAEQVGFDSPYHFSRRFKDLFGRPPSSVIPPRAASDS